MEIESTTLNVDERLIFVDIETAGLETYRPIIQIAAMAVDSDLKMLEEFDERIRFRSEDADPISLNKNCYCSKLWQRVGVSPNRAINKFASFLRRHATVDQISNRGRAYQVAQLIAHNANFDGPFLREWYRSQNVYFPASPRVFCTMQKAMWFFEENKHLTPPENYKLETLCQYFGVKLGPQRAHDAYFDVVATLEIYRQMRSNRSIDRAA